MVNNDNNNNNSNNNNSNNNNSNSNNNNNSNNSNSNNNNSNNNNSNNNKNFYFQNREKETKRCKTPNERSNVPATCTKYVYTRYVKKLYSVNIKCVFQTVAARKGNKFAKTQIFALCPPLCKVACWRPLVEDTVTCKLKVIIIYYDYLMQTHVRCLKGDKSMQEIVCYRHI